MIGIGVAMVGSGMVGTVALSRRSRTLRVFTGFVTLAVSLPAKRSTCSSSGDFTAIDGQTVVGDGVVVAGAPDIPPKRSTRDRRLR